MKSAKLTVTYLLFCSFILRVNCDSNTNLKSNWLQELREYKNRTDVIKKWDTMQQKYKCCGIESYKDWGHQDIPVPLSCCYDGNNCQTQHSSYYAQGCFDLMAHQRKNSAMGMVGIRVSSLLLAQGILIIFFNLIFYSQ